MAAMAALQSSMTSLSLSSNSFLGQRLFPPTLYPVPAKLTVKPCLIVVKLKRWERKECKPNSLPVLHKMHVKVGDTVKVISGHEKGKTGEVTKIFKHNSTVIVKEINLKTKHMKSREEGEPGQILKVEGAIHSSNVMLFSKEKNVASRVGHKILENGQRVRYLIKTGEIIDSTENWKKLKEDEDGGVQVPDASAAQLMDVPVIDLALLAASSISADELEKLRSALSTWGCFQVINHGMSPEFLDEVREIAKQFFALPVEDKKKYLRQVNDIQGYGNDMVFSEQQTLDWSDRLYLSVYPQDNRKLNLWPENPKSFRWTLDQYTMDLQVVTKTVLKAMARSLDLEDNCFSDLYGGEQGKMDIRFNFYPPCPRPDLVLGVKAHADGTLITLLLQDKEVEGLQFLKGDEWFRAPIVPDALLINVGDQVEILSNGIFKSPVHKVVTNSDKERISVAAFCIPESDKEIEPFERLVDESRPRLYKKVKNYVGIYFEYYQQGRRPMEAAII